jgi:hypothetical protein
LLVTGCAQSLRFFACAQVVRMAIGGGLFDFVPAVHKDTSGIALLGQ